MRVPPLGFCVRTKGKLQGDVDLEMTPFLMFSSMNALIFSRSKGEYGRGRVLIGLASPVSISKGFRLAGRPISRNRSRHLRLIQRSSLRGIVRGSFVTAVTEVFLAGCRSWAAALVKTITLGCVWVRRSSFVMEGGLLRVPSKVGFR